jgi:hypothetical protein
MFLSSVIVNEALKMSGPNPVLVAIRLVIGLIKFPIFIVVLTTSFLYSCLTLLIPFRSLGRLIHRFSARVLFRILLFLTGNLSIPENVTPLCDTTLEPGNPSAVSPGDLIICNFGSYLNLLWLQSRFCPLFLIPVQDDLVVVHSFYSLFMSILADTPVTSGSPQPLQAVLDCRSPLVILPECRPSEGNSVLPFTTFSLPRDDIRIHIYGFVHRDSGVAPDFTHGNGFAHLFQMTGRTLAGMKVKIAAARDVPAANSERWLERSRAVLGGILRLPLAEDLPVKAHRD